MVNHHQTPTALAGTSARLRPRGRLTSARPQSDPYRDSLRLRISSRVWTSRIRDCTGVGALVTEASSDHWSEGGRDPGFAQILAQRGGAPMVHRCLFEAVTC